MSGRALERVGRDPGPGAPLEEASSPHCQQPCRSRALSRGCPPPYPPARDACGLVLSRDFLFYNTAQAKTGCGSLESRWVKHAILSRTFWWGGDQGFLLPWNPHAWPMQTLDSPCSASAGLQHPSPSPPPGPAGLRPGRAGTGGGAQGAAVQVGESCWSPPDAGDTFTRVPLTGTPLTPLSSHPAGPGLFLLGAQGGLNPRCLSPGRT